MSSPRLLALKLIADLKPHLLGKKEVFLSEKGALHFKKLSPRPYKERAQAPIQEKFRAPPPLKKAPLQAIAKPSPTPAPPKAIPSLTLPKRERPESLSLQEASWPCRFLESQAPQVTLLDQIPSDAWAKKLASRWKTKNQVAKISLLSYSEPKEQRAFLEKIQIALDLYFGPVRLVEAEAIEKEKSWDTFLSTEELDLVIACDYTLWQLPSLRAFYRENGPSKERSLKEKPLFLLPDLSLYLKDPLLKRSLWRALCQKIKG